MNRKIRELGAKLETETYRFAETRDSIKDSLQKEWNKVWDNDKALTKALNDAESASEYGADETGIYSWFRFSGLSNIPVEAREFLRTFVAEYGGFHIDWDNECFMLYEADEITIQDDTGIGGVWLSGKLLIDESEYKENGDVDETKRNALIEAHMQKTGYYPGVFRIDQYGNVFPVSTSA